MELIGASPVHRIEFEVSLPQNLYTAMVLLQAAGRVEGLGDWVNETASRLPAAFMTRLRRFALLTGYSFGFWGGLICEPVVCETDRFDRLRAHLEGRSPDSFGLAARRGLDRRLVDWELAAEGLVLTAEGNELLDLLSRVWDERQARGHCRKDESLDDVHDLANLIERPEELRTLVLELVSQTWEQVYGKQYQQDRDKVRQAVAYHRAQHYPCEFQSAFASITGRTLPETLRQRLEKVQRIVMTPVRYIGPYLISTQSDRTLYVAFNADTISSESAAQDQVATLYTPLKALADETRLQIIQLLKDRERYVGEIADALDISHSSASRHLGLLTTAELLEMRKENNMRFYRLNPNRANTLIAHLQELFAL